VAYNKRRGHADSNREISSGGHRHLTGSLERWAAGRRSVVL